MDIREQKHVQVKKSEDGEKEKRKKKREELLEVEEEEEEEEDLHLVLLLRQVKLHEVAALFAFLIATKLVAQLTAQELDFLLT